MRTWTLTGYEVHEGDWNTWVEPEEGLLAHNEQVKVIELEPILDLLESLAANFAAMESLYPKSPHCKYIDNAKQILRDNGRLQ